MNFQMISNLQLIMMLPLLNIEVSEAFIDFTKGIEFLQLTFIPDFGLSDHYSPTHNTYSILIGINSSNILINLIKPVLAILAYSITAFLIKLASKCTSETSHPYIHSLLTLEPAMTIYYSTCIFLNPLMLSITISSPSVLKYILYFTILTCILI